MWEKKIKSERIKITNVLKYIKKKVMIFFLNCKKIKKNKQTKRERERERSKFWDTASIFNRVFLLIDSVGCVANLVDLNVEILDDDIDAELKWILHPPLLPSSSPFSIFPSLLFSSPPSLFPHWMTHCMLASLLDRSGFDVSALCWCIDLIQTNWQNRESGLVLRGIPEHR